MTVHGLLLAAGSGSRMGKPKALVDGWLSRSVDTLQAGGCHEVTVVLGAGATEASALLAEAGIVVHEVVASDWAEGMGASLRAGLASLPPDADAALVTLVDLPDVGPDVVRRVLAPADAPAPDRQTLRRATYTGTPGHPVLLGRAHWAGVADSAAGDRGARDYLVAHDADAVECGDLASGEDQDGLQESPPAPPGETPTFGQPGRQ